jgi:hypothetical protein
LQKGARRKRAITDIPVRIIEHYREQVAFAHKDDVFEKTTIIQIAISSLAAKRYE